MKTKIIAFLACVFVLTGLIITQPMLSAPANAQVFIYTPTPEANGNIYYIVKSKDTCSTISLLNNISIDALKGYNNLTDLDCDKLTVGRKLLIGIVPTAVVTPGASPTPTSSIPTPMPPTGEGTLCVYLYNDINGNAIADTGETSLAGGEISVTNANGDFSKTAPTTGDDNAVCFTNILAQTYTISVAIPDSYNATTDQNYTVTLKAGDTSTVDFGAQASSHLLPTGSSGGSSLLLAVVGVIVLLGAAGLGVFVYFTMQKK
jgi:LysM domain.